MYLYIFEDGSIKQSRKAPTKENLQEVDDGMLDIITIDDHEGIKFCRYDPDQETYVEVEWLGAIP